MRKLLGLIVVFGMIMIGYAVYKENGPDAAASRAIVAPADSPIWKQQATASIRESPPYAQVSISKAKLAKDGVVLTATFTFKNENPYDVKDLEVTCEHSGNSGTVMDRNVRTIYEIVKAKSSKTIHDFNMGFINSQAASSACRVTAASR